MHKIHIYVQFPSHSERDVPYIQYELPQDRATAASLLVNLWLDKWLLSVRIRKKCFYRLFVLHPGSKQDGGLVDQLVCVHTHFLTWRRGHLGVYTVGTTEKLKMICSWPLVADIPVQFVVAELPSFQT
jgi:hypothetical protein